MKQFADKVSILVLDYNKPEESRLCLESVQKHCKFEKEVVFYSNGGEQDYAIDFYKEGLIDKLVLSKKNWGLGCGTTDLLQLCRTEYFIYLQNDQYFYRPLDQDCIDIFISNLKLKPTWGCISLAGYPCGDGVYSDRCHFANTNTFRAFDKWEDGYPDKGVGPFWDGDEGYNENFIQRAFKNWNLVSVASEPFVQDNGKISIRENKSGSRFRHSTDEKRLWIEVAPKEKEPWPDVSDEDWELILSGRFENGSIPSSWKKDSFIVHQWH